MKKIVRIDDALDELGLIQNELERMEDKALLSLRVEKIAEWLTKVEEDYRAIKVNEESIRKALQSTR